MSHQDTKRIAKNTIFLYVRMIITMLITLYTSRVILNVLGVEDYGVYNIIAGIVVLLAFLQTAMTNASQRYITYELGKGELESVKKVFSMSMTTHITISLLIFFLAETIGLWFINTQLNIPANRMLAANWVYQFSILTFIVNLIRIPYNASIIAYENMSFYAYISIIESILKLLIVYVLCISPSDKLILYAILLCGVAIICTFIYKIYCCKKFLTCNYTYFWDKKLYWQLMRFSGWTMLGGISNVSAQQGGNILLNMYNGVVSNAAFGIANQVSYAVYAFSSNFQIAFNPQITKLHAVGDSLHLNNLVNKASLFSYYLMLLFAVPFMINTEIILKLWLKNVPEYTVGFCQLMVVYQLIDAFQAPLNTLIFSTGKIKNYNIWLSALIFCNIPLSLYLLSIGKSPYYVLGIRAGINLLTAIIRVVYVRYFMNFPSLYYFLHVVLKILAVTVLAFSGSIWVKMNLNSDTGGFILSSLIAIIITGIVVYWIGIGKTERSFFHSILKKYLRIDRIYE